jgi:4-hydroxy-tetrahydrodipicolinate synthase
LSKGKKFTGSFVALITPFVQKGNKFEIDWDALTRLIEYHVANGTTGIVIGGCNGESFTLTHEEQKKLFEFVVEAVVGRMIVIAGTGSNSTDEAIDLTVHARHCQADAAMLITPYANKPTPAGQIAHTKAICQAVPDLPIMLYNVPGRTGLKMKPATIAKLYQEVENVVAIKEASGDIDQVSQILDLCDITVLSGDDSLTLPMMAIGAKGVVSVTANIAAADVAQSVWAFLKGDVSQAIEFHRRLYPVHQAMFIETNPGPVKAAMKMKGFIADDSCRPPLAPLEPENRDKLREVLQRAKMI